MLCTTVVDSLIQAIELNCVGHSGRWSAGYSMLLVYQWPLRARAEWHCASKVFGTARRCRDWHRSADILYIEAESLKRGTATELNRDCGRVFWVPASH